ncbi:mitochondrial fission protein ELM1-like [Camellia sinensis]|uniref:mitochondrial fission protein ELM1-like n=1 Tax=Camellia sinensis TaxID=4442 RepID=UPI001036B3E3|nr:mitochondrial fission protein ELM1-like [Camellia sinensis]
MLVVGTRGSSCLHSFGTATSLVLPCSSKAFSCQLLGHLHQSLHFGNLTEGIGGIDSSCALTTGNDSIESIPPTFAENFFFDSIVAVVVVVVMVVVWSKVVVGGWLGGWYPLTPKGQEQIPWFLRRWITPREPPDRHVVLTVGALHQADSTALQVAACAWHDELAPLLKPLLVVNIGGPTKHCQYGADLAKQLTASLKNVRWSFGSLRISFSRRTPQEVSDILEKEFSYHPKVYIWDGKDPNPHMGHLAWADAFIITADSVSMLSEACSTGKPVYVIGAERCTWKFAEFHKSLQERGVVRPFTGKEDISERWSCPPLNDTAEASFRVIEALSEHGWRLEP